MAYVVDEKSRTRPLWIQSRVSNDAYRENYERIFGKKEEKSQEGTTSGAITGLVILLRPPAKKTG
jgi:hypothetical protein